jgi:hypothetical protein
MMNMDDSGSTYTGHFTYITALVTLPAVGSGSSRGHITDITSLAALSAVVSGSSRGYTTGITSLAALSAVVSGSSRGYTTGITSLATLSAVVSGSSRDVVNTISQDIISFGSIPHLGKRCTRCNFGCGFVDWRDLYMPTCGRAC